jgi:predicted nucleotidyltransferase
MDAQLTDNVVLGRFRAALSDLYGPRLSQVVVFGSRARQNATADSDYDIAVFLNDMPDRWAELGRLADLGVRFFDETGAVIDAKPYTAAAYPEKSPIVHELRREGRAI